MSMMRRNAVVKLDRKQNKSVDEKSFGLGQILKCMKLRETLVELIMVFIVQSSNALITKINISSYHGVKIHRKMK